MAGVAAVGAAAVGAAAAATSAKRSDEESQYGRESEISGDVVAVGPDWWHRAPCTPARPRNPLPAAPTAVTQRSTTIRRRTTASPVTPIAVDERGGPERPVV